MKITSVIRLSSLDIVFIIIIIIDSTENQSPLPMIPAKMFLKINAPMQIQRMI